MDRNRRQARRVTSPTPILLQPVCGPQNAQSADAWPVHDARFTRVAFRDRENVWLPAGRGGRNTELQKETEDGEVRKLMQNDHSEQQLEPERPEDRLKELRA
jgi:hypothetical protein